MDSTRTIYRFQVSFGGFPQAIIMRTNGGRANEVNDPD